MRRFQPHAAREQDTTILAPPLGIDSSIGTVQISSQEGGRDGKTRQLAGRHSCTSIKDSYRSHCIRRKGDRVDDLPHLRCGTRFHGRRCFEACGHSEKTVTLGGFASPHLGSRVPSRTKFDQDCREDKVSCPQNKNPLWTVPFFGPELLHRSLRCNLRRMRRTWPCVRSFPARRIRKLCRVAA